MSVVNNNILSLVIVIYVGMIIFLGDKIYFWLLNLIARKKLDKLGYKIEDLNFSFEQIVYLVSTPSSNYKLNDLKSDYEIEKLRVSTLCPAIDMLKIVAHTQTGEKINLALIKKDKFPVPILDTLVYHDKINQWEYDLFISYIFFHPRTHDLLLEEVKTRVIEG